MNPERWLHMADTFIKSGLIADNSHFDGFIYDHNDEAIPTWLVIFTIWLSCIGDNDQLY